MKIKLSAAVLLVALAVMLCGFASAAEANGAYTDVVIITTTDMHGKCWNKNLLTDASDNNNMLHVSAAVSEAREEYGAENVILIDNGDLYQGTPVSEAQLQKRMTGQSQEPAAMSVCLAEIGYDALVLGNHEFNFAWETMKEEYTWLEQNGVHVLAANVYYDGSDGIHAAGENAFTPYIVKTVNVNGSAHKLGILGIENCDITRWDLPDKYPGLVFAHPENASYSMAYEAKTYIERMRGEGCEFIIVSYHGGPGSADMQLAFGVNSTNQGKRIVAENDEIDLLVLGHDHVSTYSNTYLYDSAGQGVLTVNGGGQQLTKSVFRFFETETGALDWELIESKNHQIGSFRTDENLKIKMEPYAALAEEIVSQPVGTAAGAWDKSKQFYTRQTNSMDLISAAVMEEAALGLKRKFGASGAEALASAGLDHIDVDMMIGSISSASYVIYPGSLSVKDMYRLYKYENNVLVIPMYGRDIREIMEENAEKRLIARVLDGKAYIYSYGDRFTNLIFGGLNFTYDLSAPTGQRVRIGGFSNGRAFEEDKLYLVAVNNYVLGNTNCGLRVFGEEDAIWSQTEDEAGGNIHDMLISYIRRHTEQDGAVTPEAFTWHWEAVYAASDMEPDYSNVDSAASWAKTLSDGCAYVIYQESEARALTSAEKNGSIRAEYCKAFGEKLLSPLGDAVAAYTVHMNDDGSFALTEETGRYLTCLEKGGLKLTDDVSQDGLSFWYLEEAYGGWYIMNKGAGRQALEYYSGAFSTYYLSNGDYYIFNFYSKD